MMGLLPLLRRPSPRADSSPACPDEHQVKLVTRVLAPTSPHLPSASPALRPLPPHPPSL